MTRTILALTLAAAAFASGCDRGGELDTRTFTVQHLEPHQVEALLSPYVFRDRPERPGVLSVSDAAVTVRETEDNLAKIQRVLEELDQPRAAVRLRFQLIRADGAAPPDPAIAGVVQELRGLFRFEGYQLLGEAMVSAEQGGVTQGFAGTDWRLGIGDVSPGSPGTVRLRGIQIWNPAVDGGLETSVTVSSGQTLVLGNAPGADGSTVILVVRAEPRG